MKKMLLVAFIAAVIVVQGTAIQSVWAGEGSEAELKNSVAVTIGKKLSPMMKKRRSQTSREQTIHLLNEKYDFSQDELGRYLDNGKNYRELDQLCLYAYLSRKPLAKVVEFKENYTGERLKLALGLTPQNFYKRSLVYKSSRLASEIQLAESTVLKYLKQGYTDKDIKMAVFLAAASKLAVNDILKMRTIKVSWPDIAVNIGVDIDVYHQAEAKVGVIDNNGKRSGAGFAGLRIANPNKAKLVSILYNDYGFSKDELGRYYDEIGFNDLETFCMYAYFAKKPLVKVITMRDKYTWEGLKLALGLTPQKFRDRAIEYQADRLLKRMDIKRSVTIKYMRRGFPMHHVNTAALLALKCGRDIETVLLMKKPNNRWNEVAIQLGLTLQDSEEIKDRITKSFKR